jgi:hypothetical protein
VAEKKDVSSDQKIPETINGVKTDVLQNRVAPVTDDSYYNPIIGGIGIGPARIVVVKINDLFNFRRIMFDIGSLSSIEIVHLPIHLSISS